jgi:hypothetical protein
MAKVNGSRAPWIIGAIIACIVLSGVTAWSVVTLTARPEATTQQAAVVPVGEPTIITAEQLRELAQLYGPLYWVGERKGTRIEATVADSGSVYLRYLDDGVAPGDKGEYLTVATYPVVEAYSTLLAAKGKGVDVVQTQQGGVIANFDSSPESTYFAFPGGNFQVEVFSPEKDQANKLVTDGDVTPVR